jgi:Fe-S-cluster containining protein
MKYFHQGIPCPFLESESCSIHPVRPLICREYLVTSPAKNCEDPTAETIQKVPIVLKPSKAMLNVGRTKNSAGMSSLMLIEALDFVERHPDEFEEKTGERWAADFFGELTKSNEPYTAPKPPATRRKNRKKRRK